jgi:rhamnose transport system permease protein
MKRSVIRAAEHMPWFVAAVILIVCFANVAAFQRMSYWLTLSQLHFAAIALAIALTPIMLTGGIDLSVGSVTILSSVMIGFCWQELEWPIELAMACGILAGALAGLANGALITLGVLPLVATLATRELFRGLALTLSGETPVSRFPRELNQLWRTSFLGLPLSVYLLGSFFLVSYWAVHHTRFGRMVFAIGDNETAARFAALPVDRLKLGLYVWAGFVAGLCGAALVMHYNSAKADFGQSLELSAITCVILGGLRITGGAGHVGATMLGAVTVVALQTGVQSMAASSGDTAATWRDTITGALLLVVALGNEAAVRWAQKQRR